MLIYGSMFFFYCIALVFNLVTYPNLQFLLSIWYGKPNKKLSFRIPSKFSSLELKYLLLLGHLWVGQTIKVYRYKISETIDPSCDREIENRLLRDCVQRTMIGETP